MTRLIPLLLLPLLACSGGSVDQDGKSAGAGDEGDDTPELDGDGDGYLISEGDCDDTNPDRHPGAAEVCNDRDDDCDPNIDEDATDAITYYEDLDYDGYGSPEHSVTRCDPPVGYATNDLDCDDTLATINPETPETCNGVDDDCDGTPDSPPPPDARTWYLDGDGDWYGEPSGTTGVIACDKPTGYSGNTKDCDDTDPDSFPGSAEAESSTACMTDHDRDGWGDESAPPDGVAGTDCSDNDALTYPSAPESCFDGIDNGCDGDTSCDLDTDRWGRLLGEAAGDRTGTAIAYVGDCDGDGKGDVVVGAYLTDEGVTDSGSGYFIPGPLKDYDLNIRNAHGMYSAPAGADQAGYSVGAAGDVNSDGFDDFFVNAQQYDTTGKSSAGGAFLYLGPPPGGRLVLDASADVWYTGKAASDLAGIGAVGVGDVNGDGIDDMVVGAAGNDDGGTDSGAAWLIVGPPTTGAQALGSVGIELVGEAASDQAGRAIAGLGDYDGDGVGDFAIGAHVNDQSKSNAGAAYIFLGAPTGSSVDLSAADFILRGFNISDYVGYSIAGPGDTNADGYDDLLIGLFGDDNSASGAGAAALFLGESAPATAYITKADTTIRGEAPDDQLGRAVAAAGDLDTDGSPDVAVGAHQANPGGLADAGRVYVFLSPLPSGVVSAAAADGYVSGSSAGDYAGSALAGGGDVTGDGADDLLVGAYGEDTAGSDGGAVYILPGRL
jgi:hypothetical protein